ncbi:MAG: hypothetical protein GXY77_05605 [Fibrobacter sp.]|nr:hypothetical protein [Fibrobacter sp.]
MNARILVEAYLWFCSFLRVNPTHFPPLRTIGPDQVCDIGYIEEGNNFKITTEINLPQYQFEMNPNEKIRMELIAVADNSKSKSLYIEIGWDGIWVNDAKGMGDHLSITKTDKF